MRFVGLVSFHESTPNKSLMNVKKLFNIFSRICGDIRARSSTFADNPRKVRTFRGLYRGKACLSGV
jgi:hypothetical protein